MSDSLQPDDAAARSAVRELEVAADRIIDHLGPMLVFQPRKRFAKDIVLIVDGTLVPARDHTVAERSKN